MLRPVVSYRTPYSRTGRPNRVGEATLPPIPGEATVQIITTNRQAKRRFYRHIQDGHAPLLSDQAEAQGFQFGHFNTPEEPHWWYFNPGLYEHNGLWLVTRKTFAQLSPGSHWSDYLCRISRFRINDDMSVSDQEPLAWPNRHPSEQTDDPRMCWMGGKLHLSNCCWVTPPSGKPFQTIVHQTLAVLDGWRVDRLIDVPFGGNNRDLTLGSRMEKNWLWFEHNGNPHFSYTTRPHVVVRVNNGEAVETHQTDSHMDWPYGEVRGGTPPVLVGDEYVTFFHSSLPWQKVNGAMRNRYYMGALAFEARPPFGITRYTRSPLLTGTLREPSVLMSPPCVFPSGALLRSDEWLVTLGVNDCLASWMKCGKGSIDRLLLPTQ